MIGEKFGTLTVIEERPKRIGYSDKFYLVRCDCGVEKVIPKQRLKRVKSCGCLTKQIIGDHQRKHGDSIKKAENHRSYYIWHSMKARCYRKTHKSYLAYGGRGITVSNEWMSYEVFISDMGHPPSRKHTLERIDNSKNYCKENCKWATHQEQARNRRSSKYITFNGQKKTQSEWADILKIPRDTMSWRLKSGWSIEKTLTTPVKIQKNNRRTYD